MRPDHKASIRFRSTQDNATEEPTATGAEEGAAQGEEERRPWARAHQEHVQQHDRLDHRPGRQRDRLGLRRPGGLQGLAQVHPVRRADGRRGRRPSREGARHAQGRRLRQGPGLGPRDRDPLAPGRRPRGRLDPGRHPAAAQRLPPAEAPPRLTEERTEPWPVTQDRCTKKSRRLER